jgi:hypothetical protein
MLIKETSYIQLGINFKQRKFVFENSACVNPYNSIADFFISNDGYILKTFNIILKKVPAFMRLGMLFKQKIFEYFFN